MENIWITCKINLELNDVKNAYWTDGSVTVPSLNAALFVDYIYLDTDERRRFAQVSHEYLIEQLQFTGDESTSNTNNKIKLNFNHPCKELIWVVQPDDNVASGSTTNAVFGPQWFNYTDALDPSYSTGLWSSNVDVVSPGSATAVHVSGGMPGVAAGGATGVFVPVSFDAGANPVALAKLQLNGHDRFSERDGRYFNLVQPYQHHENIPSQGVNVYSFGLKPEEHQPSGTCNFSRIDNATLQLTLTDSTVKASGGASRTAKVRVIKARKSCLGTASFGHTGLSNTPCCGNTLRALSTAHCMKVH